jgi:hypothetical protein
MSLSVKKERGRLVFRDFGGYETRNPSTIWCIKQADEIYHWKDFPEITIYTGDKSESCTDYTYSKMNSYNNLVPDFNFHSWKQVGISNYSITVDQIDASGQTPYKISKVGWIGNTGTHPLRKKLLEIGMSRPDLFDIMDMKWLPSTNTTLQSTTYLSLSELVSTYQMLIDIEGVGYSGRVKYLLWSHRPLLLVNRPHKEFFFQYLTPWVHYIPVKRNLSDLIRKTEWCINNYERSLQIAENAFQFSKTYLTRQACYKQWDNIISNIKVKSSYYFIILPILLFIIIMYLNNR